MTAEEIIQTIKDQYYLCPNIDEDVCYTWWKHEECEALRSLLYTVTKDLKYVEPLSKLRPNVASAMEELLNDPENQHVMERLKYMEDNGI
jgi:hypothetical protein